MQLQIFDIVLISFAIVILLHLFYNKSLFDNKYEHMTINDLCIDPPCTNLHDPIPQIPDRSGLDETHPDVLPWYHVTNRLLNESEIPINKIYNKRECESDDKVNITVTNDNKLKLCKKSYNILFGDNYEGRLTSDPFEAGIKKVPETFDLDAFDLNNKNELYIDKYGNTCPTNEHTKNMKRYIREYVLDGKQSCECAIDKSKSEFTRDEIDDYRDAQIEFRNKLYGSSAPAEDPVDKMNHIVVDGGIRMIKGTGKKISEFYDDLVTCNYDDSTKKISNLNGPGFVHGSSLPNSNCVKPPILDMEGTVPTAYHMNGIGQDRHFVRDNWRYNNENPNNGGVMYNGLRGTDPLSDLNVHRVIQ